jgi:biopolymer transport protein ExbD
MMRLPNHVSSSPVSFNMTPMIDVVFLLIIFFLLSSHLARRESQVELSLPAAASGEDAWDENTPRCTLNVLADGTILLGGRVTQPEELDRRLRNVQAELGPRAEMRIRADRRVAYRHVNPILSAAARVGIGSVTFSVIRPEDAR